MAEVLPPGLTPMVTGALGLPSSRYVDRAGVVAVGEADAQIIRPSGRAGCLGRGQLAEGLGGSVTPRLSNRQTVSVRTDIKYNSGHVRRRVRGDSRPGPCGAGGPYRL